MQGIWPILYAYFDGADRLDRTAMRRQVEVALRCGAPGVAVLGLATEVNKLSFDEKRCVVEWAAADLGGAAPLALTLSGATVEEQIELARVGLEARAGWFILQPPAGAKPAEAELADFFGSVLARLAELAPQVPAGIQNAPEFLGVGLGPQRLAALRHGHPNLKFLKGEAPAVIIEQTVQRLGPEFPVLNGRGGLELIDNLRAGCAGMIVAPDCAWEQQRVAELLAAGRDEEAERLYAAILPGIVFVMQSLEALIVYGKRIAAWRGGFDVLHDRRCQLEATAFGLKIARRFAEALGPLPGCAMTPVPREN